MSDIDRLLDELITETGVTVTDVPASRGGAHHHVEVDPDAKLPDDLPEAVRAILKYPPAQFEGDRSKVFYSQVLTAILWGLTDEQVVLVARASAHGRDKYGDQVDDETARIIAKEQHKRGRDKRKSDERAEAEAVANAEAAELRRAAELDEARPAPAEGVSSLLSLSSQANTHPVLDPAAYHGLAGEVVALLDPHTEADPAGVLVSFLAAFGAMVGPGPHAMVSGAQHPARIYPVPVGPTAKGRKGTTWSTTRYLLNVVDPTFIENRVMGGFGSGEAVVDEVVDSESETGPVTDKRLLVYEPEFAHLLKVASRDGSTLSPLLRAAWDGERLAVRSRAKKAVASGAHIVILGHITSEELRKHVGEVEVANGFANRFMFICVRRSKLLPEGGDLREEDMAPLACSVRHALREARSIGLVQRDPEARVLWAQLYQRIADQDRDGLVGAVTARADATVLRLSVIYALLDCSQTIRPVHLEAAWALWRYAEASAQYVFGDALGDPMADRLLAAIRAAGHEGLDTTEQHAVLGRHASANQLDDARATLHRRGLIETVKQETGGRPRMVSVAKEAKEAKEGRAA